MLAPFERNRFTRVTKCDRWRACLVAQLMPAATRVMMSHALIRCRRNLILVAVKMTYCLCADRNAVQPFRRVRHSARPQREGEHHGANKGSPTVHQRSPSSGAKQLKCLVTNEGAQRPCQLATIRLAEQSAAYRDIRVNYLLGSTNFIQPPRQVG